MYSIKGDPSDGKGVTCDVNLEAGAAAHPQVRFGDRIIETDVYVMGETLMLHMYCPRCENANRISSEKKRVSWNGGERLSVAGFLCTWPGCGLAIRIDDNIAIEFDTSELSAGF